MRTPPKLSASQRQDALDKAARSRKARAEIKNRVKSGELSFTEVLDLAKSDSVAGKMRVRELIEAVPGVGKIRASAMMERLEISLTRRIQGLGVHQIGALVREFPMTHSAKRRGKLIVLSGPGGVGKSTIADRLRSQHNFYVSVSATTRLPRTNEREGIDYFFLSREEFSKKIANDEFLEWAEFAGAMYGTPRIGVENSLAQGHDVLLEIEIEGAKQVKAHSAEAILVFLQPPSWEHLVARLEARGTDTPERRVERLALAQEEMAASGEFDLVLINDAVENVVLRLVSLTT